MDLILKKSLDKLAQGCLGIAVKMHRSDIIKDIKELWRSLTIDRRTQVHEYFQKASSRRAYIGYYFPMYVAKIAILLNRLEKEGRFDCFKGKPLKVLDLGSGTLTGIAALKLVFKDHAFQAQAIDKSLAPMRLGLDVLTEVFSAELRHEIYLRQANLLGPRNLFLPKWKPNFMFLGHVLNELGEGHRALPRKIELLNDLFNHLEPGGMILIVEPATRGPTRDLMALRDVFAHEGRVNIQGPCTGSSECPLLKTATSWCFCELGWQRPQEFKRIDDVIGFERDSLKTSYLLLENNPPQTRSQGEARVVSGAMTHAEIMRRYLCTSEGLKTLETKVTGKSYSLANTTMRGEILPDTLLQAPDVKIHKEI